MRKILAVMVGALLLTTTATSPVVGASTTPVVMEDGTVRYGVALSQSPETDKFVIANYAGVPVTVSYFDPTYGSQSVTLQPNYDSVVICADDTFREQNLVSVTFNSGAPDQATGSAKYATVYTGAFDVGVREAAVEAAKASVSEKRTALAKAKKQLRKARVSLNRARSILRSAKVSGKVVLIKSAVRNLRTAERRFRVAKRKVATAQRKLESAKALLVLASAELAEAHEQMAFCINRRVG